MDKKHHMKMDDQQIATAILAVTTMSFLGFAGCLCMLRACCQNRDHEASADVLQTQSYLSSQGDPKENV